MTKPTRYYSGKQEKQVAKTTNSKKQKNSGASMFCKGDLKSEKFLIECKTKAKSSESISIKKEWIDKIKQEMFAMNREYWSVAFSFGNNKNYYIIDEDLFCQLKEMIENE
jgi:hypothetical protein